MRLGTGPVQRRLVDVVIAVTMTALTITFALQYHPGAPWPPFDAWAIALSAVTGLPLAFRRAAPRTVLAVSCAGLVLYSAGGYQPSANVWPPMLAFFTVATELPTCQVLPGALLTACVWEYAGLSAHVLSVVVATAQTVLVLGLAWAFGAGARRLAERNGQLRVLTRRLQLEQAARARHEVTEERMRIARELHDVVAHHLSVIAIQSGLARYVFDTEPDTARTAVGTVADTARQSLEEMRGLLQVLRLPPADGNGPEAPVAPPEGSTPGLSDLPELVERVRAAGVDADLSVTGVARPLPPGGDLSTYRIVQEALTNVLKHAPAARATVALHYARDLLVVRVDDDGGGSGAERLPGGGQGLLGMRERAKLYGGTFAAGPRRQGGYEVLLTLPLPAPPAGAYRADTGTGRPRAGTDPAGTGRGGGEETGP
ncbi:sensor histidine kinase [Streptomyces sp. HU2014]|uniref:sensor histidine kinase n=1 Tax=Streptomyces sp. HU2014 TaxID=2939414 RepID=UPI00200BC815|nr:sensor histidine kinase [Streptomyces sp. HU2014]UQI45131.1 sensor histidine kinase [Streptomyces sp. HU2014]